jgi:hypothetical protein
MIKSFFLIILFSVFTQSLTAQFFEKVKYIFGNVDTNYVYKYPHRFIINPSFTIKNSNITVKDINNQGTTLVFKPNSPMKMGLVFAYKWARLSMGFKIPSYLNNKGNTETFMLNLTLQTRVQNWGGDAYVIHNKGFYLSNPQSVISTWSDRQAYPFYNTMQMLELGAFTYVIFSDRLSLKSALQQNERQKTNAGGIAFQMGIKYTGLLTDPSFIPAAQKRFYLPLNETMKVGIMQMSFSPGYAYTFVYKYIFATSVANVGLGFQTVSYESGISKGVLLDLTPKYKLQQIIGYNGDDAFVKLIFQYENTSFQIENIKFLSNRFSFTLGGGLRFR